MKISELGLLSLGALGLALVPLPASLPVLGTPAAVAGGNGGGGGNGGDHGGGGNHGGGHGNASSGQSSLKTYGNSSSHSSAASTHNTTGKTASALGGLNAYHALINGNAGANASPDSAVGMIQTYVNDLNDPNVTQDQLNSDLQALSAINPNLSDPNAQDGLNATTVDAFNTALADAGLINSTN